MAIDYGPIGLAGDQVNCSAEVEDDDLGVGDRTNLHFTLKRVVGGTTTVNLWVILVSTGAGDPAVIDPPGTIAGAVSLGFKGGIELQANQEDDQLFIIDNPNGAADTAEYLTFSFLQIGVNFFLAGAFTPHTVLG